MRWYLMIVAALLAGMPASQEAAAQVVPPAQNKSVKLRLEIELRGLLSVTEKRVTVTNKETVYEYRPKLGLQSRQVDKVWVLELDENQKKMAKALDGKEVEVIGKCLVLGVKSAADSTRVPAAGAGPGRPELRPEMTLTSVASELELDSKVIVISLKAAE
jgi:hypothetical protein